MQLRVASKESDNFLEYCNEIYALWSVQYFLSCNNVQYFLNCTNQSAYILLTFQNQCNIQFKIYALALSFDLRCEKVVHTHIYII